MNLFERMKEIFGSGIDVFSARMEIVDFGKMAVFGAGRVLLVSKEEIVLLAGGEELYIKGENLSVEMCDVGEIYIMGEIKSVAKTSE